MYIISDSTETEDNVSESENNVNIDFNSHKNKKSTDNVTEEERISYLKLIKFLNSDSEESNSDIKDSQNINTNHKKGKNIFNSTDDLNYLQDLENIEIVPNTKEKKSQNKDNSSDTNLLQYKKCINREDKTTQNNNSLHVKDKINEFCDEISCVRSVPTKTEAKCKNKINLKKTAISDEHVCCEKTKNKNSVLNAEFPNKILKKNKVQIQKEIEECDESKSEKNYNDENMIPIKISDQNIVSKDTIMNTEPIEFKKVFVKLSRLNEKIESRNFHSKKRKNMFNSMADSNYLRDFGNVQTFSSTIKKKRKSNDDSVDMNLLQYNKHINHEDKTVQNNYNVHVKEKINECCDEISYIDSVTTITEAKCENKIDLKKTAINNEHVCCQKTKNKNSVLNAEYSNKILKQNKIQTQKEIEQYDEQKNKSSYNDENIIPIKTCDRKVVSKDIIINTEPIEFEKVFLKLPSLNEKNKSSYKNNMNHTSDEFDRSENNINTFDDLISNTSSISDSPKSSTSSTAMSLQLSVSGISDSPKSSPSRAVISPQPSTSGIGNHSKVSPSRTVISPQPSTSGIGNHSEANPSRTVISPPPSMSGISNHSEASPSRTVISPQPSTSGIANHSKASPSRTVISPQPSMSGIANHSKASPSRTVISPQPSMSGIANHSKASPSRTATNPEPNTSTNSKNLKTAEWIDVKNSFGNIVDTEEKKINNDVLDSYVNVEDSSGEESENSNWWNKNNIPAEVCTFDNCTFEPEIHIKHPLPSKHMSIYEKRILLKYIIMTNNFKYIRGVKVWHLMHNDGYLMHRSVDTLRNAMRRTIMPYIHSFGLTPEIETKFLAAFNQN